MSDHLRVWLPGFGEHIGTGSDGSPALSGGDQIMIQVSPEGSPGLAVMISPEEAERLAGNLTVLAFKARRQARENDKTMEGTK